MTREKLLPPSREEIAIRAIYSGISTLVSECVKSVESVKMSAAYAKALQIVLAEGRGILPEKCLKEGALLLQDKRLRDVDLPPKKSHHTSSRNPKSACFSSRG